MASKQQFEVVADEVEIEDLWRALTKDSIEVARKADPTLLTKAEILEGDGIGLGSLICISFGPDKAAPGDESFKERIVEFDENKHVLSYEGIEGGYLKLGFTHYAISFKLDDVGGSRTLITASVTYTLEQNFDGTQVVEDILKVVRHYVNSIVSYLQKNKA